MLQRLKTIVENFKARRRGETRVPGATRGRIYARPSAGTDEDKVAAKAAPSLKLSARVYRAATDTWEDLNLG